MDSDELKRRLTELDGDVLRDFVLDLYVHSPELGARIEALALMNDPAALKKTLTKRVQSVRRGRRFIDYHASFSYARDLEALVSDIENGLLDSSPRSAFELADRFLATANGVFGRVDDSAGAVADVYRGAVLLWLTAARSWGAEDIDWVDRVYQLYQVNDYGVLDPLLPNSHILLNRDQLTQLAWRFESETRKATKENSPDNGFNMAALKSGVALGMVAQALKDPALYERSVLIGSPEPNDLQKKDIVAMYLRFRQLGEALRWLNMSWQSRFEDDRLELLDELYTQTGDVDELKAIRRQRYQRQQNFSSLAHYMEILPDEEKLVVRQEAVDEAERGGNVIVSADLLLQLGESARAEALVLARHQELPESFYDSLIGLARGFEKADCLPAAAACYRALLLDILNSGRSKAYTHAARYFKKLGAMAEQTTRYEPMVPHDVFVARLQQDHARKRSFWARVEK